MDGNCMYQAVWEQFSFDDVDGDQPPEKSEQGKEYTVQRLRFQVAMSLIRMFFVSKAYIERRDCFLVTFQSNYKCLCLLQEKTGGKDYMLDIMDKIRMIYGGGDPDAPGPFTLEQYLK